MRGEHTLRPRDDSSFGTITREKFVSALVYRNVFWKLPDWLDNIIDAVSLAAMLGCTGIVVHSFVDFTFRFPPMRHGSMR